VTCAPVDLAHRSLRARAGERWQIGQVASESRCVGMLIESHCREGQQLIVHLRIICAQDGLARNPHPLGAGRRLDNVRSRSLLPQPPDPGSASEPRPSFTRVLQRLSPSSPADPMYVWCRSCATDPDPTSCSRRTLAESHCSRPSSHPPGAPEMGAMVAGRSRSSRFVASTRARRAPDVRFISQAQAARPLDELALERPQLNCS
jgi:hypothetical protein